MLLYGERSSCHGVHGVEDAQWRRLYVLHLQLVVACLCWVWCPHYVPTGVTQKLLVRIRGAG